MPSSGALIVGHPGHELRVHGWLERAHPLVYTITDGSGRAGEGRLASSARVVERAGARWGSVRTRFTDQTFYEAVLARDAAPFLALVEEFVEDLLKEGVDVVVGDAVEGYNPAHDLCRVIVDATVRRVRSARGSCRNLQFPLIGPPAEGDPGLDSLEIVLDEDALTRKLEAARAYPALVEEVEDALSRFGREAFRKERLTPRGEHEGDVSPPGGRPFYETWGETRVTEGVYAEAVRFRDHVEPLAAAIWLSAGPSP